MVLKNLEHLETFAVKGGPRILEKETSRPILDHGTKLTLPKLACQSVPSVRQEEVIRASRRETRGAKPEQKDVTCLKVILGRLDGGQSETVRRDRNGTGRTSGDETRTGGEPPRMEAREVEVERSSTVDRSPEPSYAVAGERAGQPNEGTEDESPPRLPEDDEEDWPP